MVAFTYIGLGALQARAMGALVAATNEAAEDLVGKAQAEAPVDEGTLRGSIHTDGAKVAGFVVTARVQTGGEASDYAIAQHEGAGPHVIRPRNARVLAFNGTFAMRVNHPGNPPTKFLERPLLAHAAVYRAHIAAASRAAF